MLDLPSKMQWVTYGIAGRKASNLYQNFLLQEENRPRFYPRFENSPRKFLAFEVTNREEEKIYLLYHEGHLTKVQELYGKEDATCWWVVRMPDVSQLCYDILFHRHKANLVKEDPEPLYIGRLVDIAPPLSIHRVRYGHIFEINVGDLPEGTFLAYSYKASMPRVFLIYNGKELKTIHDNIESGNYRFPDFAFYHVRMSREVSCDLFDLEAHFEIEKVPKVVAQE